MTKSVFLSVEDDEKRKKIAEFYNQFMNQQNAQPQSFDSLDEFKNSQYYRDLPEEEKERLKQYEGKDVIVLVFETTEQAMEFIKQIQKKGLISEEQAEQVLEQLQEEESYRPRMQ
ncbi:Uncharacterised protein [Legionella steigerwaltii]|uniref:Uncharacterized protein n=1 Tax=Legionella steigerwaltii TaxID=460 RepID=A0A378LCQ2_9GAMM|nr:hypothetical protein [Legionella steigerwaltii]KTD80805.1 hypothetical protein Lstg_0032 [Legionella steigerwaltii]STY23509.1 Uncharacterised protein [Legionella steigerwaltii]